MCMTNNIICDKFTIQLASVELTQARPNYLYYIWRLGMFLWFSSFRSSGL